MPCLASLIGRIACLSSQTARRAMAWRRDGRIGEAQECERLAEQLAEILADVNEPSRLPPATLDRGQADAGTI